MNDDMKWFLIVVLLFIFLPVVGMGVSEWRKQDCRVELSKAGKSAEEIKEICK